MARRSHEAKAADFFLPAATCQLYFPMLHALCFCNNGPRIRLRRNNGQRTCIRSVPVLPHLQLAGIRHNDTRDVAQSGQRTCLGSRGPAVQIRPSRPVLARIIHETVSRDREDGRATGQPQGIGSEAYLESTSQDTITEDARKDGHIRGRSRRFVNSAG